MTDIAELLKDCPTGTKLYSPLLGEVEFAEVMDTDYVPIRVMCGIIGERFDKYGRYKGNEYPDAECLLFPSKEVRTWEGWKPPVEPKFKVGDWIVRGEGFVYEPSLITEIRDYYVCELLNGERVTYALNDVHKNFHLWTIADAKDGDVLSTNSIICIFKELDKDGYYIISPCIYTVKGGLEVINDETDSIGSYGFKPATKEDRKLLFRKIKEAGYEWDAEKKELKKIKVHYDITNFHAGMPVLIRDAKGEEWRYTEFSHLSSRFETYKFCAGCTYWRQCIPFNDDTKHLLGTTDPCDERFINW